METILAIVILALVGWALWERQCRLRAERRETVELRTGDWLLGNIKEPPSYRELVDAGILDEKDLELEPYEIYLIWDKVRIEYMRRGEI